MNFRQFAEQYKAGKVEVTFKKGIEECEAMFDEGCKASLSISHHTGFDCVCFDCDFSMYEEYNKQFYRPDYFDKNGNATLKVYETQFYPKNLTEPCFFDWDDEVEDYFEINTESSNELYNEYRKESLCESSYVTWLENKIKELRG